MEMSMSSDKIINYLDFLQLIYNDFTIIFINDHQF